MKNKILKIILLGILAVSSLTLANTIRKTSNSKENRAKSTVSSRKNIGESRARSIALSRVKGANNSHIRKIKLDYEDGRSVYEGEIHYNGWEYDFEIDAVNGNVIKWEKERN